ncbi:MAG: hypothetical protein K8S87_07880 [Planctomycetes bacterium]|nr:hypothetical protein [Planctomycetota bacterium]
MFEINLIKDRVVPISRKIMRTFIVTAYYTVVLFATLVILIMSFSWETKNKAKVLDHTKLEEDFQKNQEDRKRYDDNFLEGTRIFQENLALKQPWANRINFSFLFEKLYSKWQTKNFYQHASITDINYNANYNPDSYDKDLSDKLIIFGLFYDNPQNPQVPGSFNRMQSFVDIQLGVLRDELLVDKDFKEKSNISTIEFDTAPTGYKESDVTDENRCYFRIIMTADKPILPRPEEEKPEDKKK